jgi:hypothetical protein
VLGDARSLVGGRSKASVSPPPTSAPRHDELLAQFGQVAQQFATVGVVHDGAGWHGNAYIITRRTMLVLAPSVLAPFGPKMTAPAEGIQGVEVGIDDEQHVTALSTVAARRPAVGNILFAAEGDTPIASIARFDINLGLVVEHGGGRIPQMGRMSRGSGTRH